MFRKLISSGDIYCVRFCVYVLPCLGPVTLAVSSSRVTLTCTRKRVVSFIVHFAGAKRTGQMRQTRVRIRPSVPSLYYQTMQLPIGSAGSEFSRRASLQRALRSSVSVFFETSIWSDAFRRVTRRETRSLEYEKGWMTVFFAATVVATQDDLSRINF